jgi:disulfide oxidoreductase YuzD
MTNELIRLVEKDYDIWTLDPEGHKAIRMTRMNMPMLKEISAYMASAYGRKVSPNAIAAKYKRVANPEWYEKQKEIVNNKKKAEEQQQPEAVQTQLELNGNSVQVLSSGFVDVTVKLRVPISEILNNKNIVDYIVQ